jgi:2-polyprenyl-6-methoxyphenol hydroxylase-like FAD-dependent oxidoreductase
VRRKSVLISGAGIAGPALAYWLRHRGFEPTLIEQASHFREGGYMIDFWGVGYDVAERMNLIPRLRDVGYLIDCVKFVDERGRMRSGFDAKVLRRTLGNRFFSLPRGDLARAIFDTVADKIETIFGDSITAIHEDPDGLDVQFEHGHARRFDLIAGCDGLHSIVRKLTFGEENRFEKFLGYSVAAFEVTRYRPRDEDIYINYSTPGKQVGRLSLRNDRTLFLFVFADERGNLIDSDDTEAQRKALRAQFGNLGWECPQILAAMESCPELYFDRVSQIRMPSWSRGRATLIGDAAYCPSLLAGEGTGFALAGAYLLAGELQRASGDYVLAYRAYEQRFRPFIERKQQSAAQFATSFTPKTRPGLLVRDLVLQFAAFSPVSHWLMRRFVTDRFKLPDYPT